VARGFESYAEECFAALRGQPGLEVTLAAGRGPSEDGRVTVPVPPPDSRLLAAAGRAVRRDGYFAQQLLFSAGLLGVLAARRPHVVLVSDWVLASALGRWRALGRRRFPKLLLSNGAPGGPRFDWSVDHVQQLTPRMYRVAIEGGEPPSRHTLLPLAADIPPVLPEAGEPERARVRARLGLEPGAELLLCVAALNRWSKRLDYLVDEVASLERRPHLLLLGQPEAETAEVLAHARRRLGTGFTALTVPRTEVAAYYRAADVFVLPSRYEAMGRVLVEALAHGLPVLAHDADWSRSVLGEHGFLADLERPGALAELIEQVRAGDGGRQARLARHRDAYERFSWERMTPRYVEMIRACAAA
jgi:glycosyltransferase involved in cell wall biosynthesis